MHYRSGGAINEDQPDLCSPDKTRAVPDQFLPFCEAKKETGCRASPHQVESLAGRQQRIAPDAKKTVHLLAQGKIYRPFYLLTVTRRSATVRASNRD